MTPDDLIRHVDKGEIAPLYVLFGEEDYLVERALQRLIDSIVNPDLKDFNFTQYFGREARAEQIIESAMTLPMFADRRVIVVKRADELPADAYEPLLDYARQPSRETCLILQAVKIDQRRKFFQEIKKSDLLVEFRKMRDEQLTGFVRREAESSGKSISAEAAELLVYYCGNNLRELVSQLEKLAAFCGQRQAITLDDVRTMASDTKIDSSFELADALGRKSLDRALRQMQTVLRDSDAPYMLIGALARHFRQLCVVNDLVRRKVPFDDIGRQAKISPYFLKGVVEQARNFRPEELREIMIRLHETDLSLKSGGRQRPLLEGLVFAVCSRG